MNGGIFGVSSSEHADRRLIIRECLFTGRVSGQACSGTIAGLGPDISDCLVLSDGFESGVATVQTNTSNNGSSGGQIGNNIDDYWAISGLPQPRDAGAVDPPSGSRSPRVMPMNRRFWGMI